MQRTIQSVLALFLAAFLISSYASDSAPAKRDPFNDADSQLSRSGQSQSEMSRDTSK